MGASGESRFQRRLTGRLQFSLQTLLAVVFVAALFCGWFGWRLRKSKQQASAVDVLQELGALYAYDFQGPITRSTTKPYGKLVVTPGRSSYPHWLHQWLGVNFLHNVTRVHLETSYRLPDGDIDRLWSALSNLPDLTYLEASGPVTRPGALLALNRSRRLKRLALRWAHIADNDLRVLSTMPRLEELNLNETPVTDEAMLHVAATESLQAIELHHTDVTDDGLRELARLPRLLRLRLSGTEIGDPGVRHLRGHPTVRDLNLEHTTITDSAFPHIASIKSLERLDLSLNAITEKGIGQLLPLSRLGYLRLQGTAAEPTVLSVLSNLPALQELEIDFRTVPDDFSAIAGFANLRALRCPLPIHSASKQLMLPRSLEEITIPSLSDPGIFQQLVSLPRLRTVHTRLTAFSPDDLEHADAVNRFRAARADVQIINQ